MGRALLILHKACANCGAEFCKDKRYSRAYWQRAKYCSQECAGVARRAELAARRPSLEVSFNSWIQKSAGCWLWKGAVDKDGYGVFSYYKKTYRAPRIALQVAGTKVMQGDLVCHTCDTPRCVNPSHLYVGNPQSNVDDAVARDRHMRGMRSPHTKLTDEDVNAIRLASGTHNEIALRYSVTSSTISLIRSRKTWKHLP